MTRRMSSRRVALTATFTLLAMGGVAACDTAEDPNEDGHAYCTNADGVIIDESYCDESSQNYDSGSFIWIGGTSVHGSNGTYATGTKLPPAGHKFSITDKTSRAKFGLPTSGRITNGTVKTGVIGKGGPGSTAKIGSKGGSGTGSKSGS